MAHGTVELVSFGIVEITPAGAAAMRTLQLRMIVTNRDAATPWSIDATEVRLELDGRSERPLFVSSDVATLPIAISDRGEHRVLDLYFAVPAAPAGEVDVPAFTVRWQLRTPDRADSFSAWFARQETNLSPAADLLPLPGWGGQWWYDAGYPWPLYDHRDGPITHRPPIAVAITRVLR